MHRKPSGRGAMYYIRGAAGLAAGLAALKVVEALVAPPVTDAPRWIVAVVVTMNLWLAAAALGCLALLGWVSYRLFGWPAAPPPSAIEPRRVVVTPAMRMHDRAFNIVAGWLGLGILTLIVMADTRTGPFARLAVRLFGPSAFSGLETFVLGVPAVIAPLVLLAWLPAQTRFPLLASVQAIVTPPPSTRTRRRKRP